MSKAIINFLRKIVHRIFDIVLAAFGLILIMPIIVIITILGYFDTGSPFFFQRRVGMNQASFVLIKFRTMGVNTASVSTHLVDSSSITRLGRFLRKTKLDELPQLYNVLTGDMSLVGPRPCLESQVELVDEREKRLIFSVRPGISGLAQISQVDMSTPRKLAKYDKLMLDKMNFCIYIGIIYKTVLGKGFGDRVKR